MTHCKSLTCPENSVSGLLIRYIRKYLQAFINNVTSRTSDCLQGQVHIYCYYFSINDTNTFLTNRDASDKSNETWCDYSIRPAQALSIPCSWLMIHIMCFRVPLLFLRLSFQMLLSCYQGWGKQYLLVRQTQGSKVGGGVDVQCMLPSRGVPGKV